MALSQDDITLAARWLAGSRGVLFITGAGISADSGLPTYRGVGGLYEDAATDEGVPIEVALSGAMMERDPALTWKYIAQIERTCRGARPNRAHEILADLERRLPRAWVLTQNVDGFHRDAGSRNLIEIHGTVRALRCTGCPSRREVTDFAALTTIPPACAACGAVERPDVVLFGEWLPSRAMALLEQELARGFDLVFSIGTTSAFPYIAGPVLEARRRGARTVEINPGGSEVSRVVDLRLRAGAATTMQAIAAALPGP